MEKKISDGLIVIDKPSGLSSFLAVNITKRSLKAVKAGHMGTLDPLASGVLVVGVGKGTKMFDHFLKHEKEYYAEYEFGYETDTLDLEGEVLKTDPDACVTEEQIKAVLPKFMGKILQMPPVYSAKKIGGQKACDLARAGKEVALNPKEVEVFKLDFAGQIAPNKFGVNIRCSSGFYVRALGRDIAAALGTVSTTTCIRRTYACGFTLASAQTLEDIKAGNAVIHEIAKEGK